MAIQTTMGQLVINQALPEKHRDYKRVLTKKGISQLLEEIARESPEAYRDTTFKLQRMAQRMAYESGSDSFGLEHMQRSPSATKNREKLKAKLDALYSDDSLSDSARDERIIKMVSELAGSQQGEIYDEAIAANNPLARQVASGARGNKGNLASLLGSDLLYVDHRGRPIPVPIIRGFTQGVSPAEYWAGSYGARKGIIDTKTSTAASGFLAKQLTQVAHRAIVTDTDADGIPDTIQGMPAEIDDPDNEGALLAVPVGGYDRNTIITPTILKQLKRRGVKRLLVRSPVVSGTPDGGVYANDVGIREFGRLPMRGENVGLSAVQSMSEPLTQSQLSSKHSGGVAGATKAIGGFAYIDSLLQVPKTMKGGASHSEEDGVVSAIQEAPAGGYNVIINDQTHYVPQGMALKVKKGQYVEAGDILSDGIPNPSIVVKHKGVGEGRRYFVDTFRQAFRDIGLNVHRRNAELLSRGLINHVKLTDEAGDNIPGDVVPYNMFAHAYKPREGTQERTPTASVGRYLEKPYLHYSIGTRVRPSMLRDFKDFGVSKIDVHDDPPPFEPVMVRAMANLGSDPDWQVQMFGSGLKTNLLESARRGSTSTDQSTSFVPGLARSVDFGLTGMVKTPKSAAAIRPISGYSNIGNTPDQGKLQPPAAKPPQAPKPVPKPAPAAPAPAPAPTSIGVPPAELKPPTPPTPPTQPYPAQYTGVSGNVGNQPAMTPQQNAEAYKAWSDYTKAQQEYDAYQKALRNAMNEQLQAQNPNRITKPEPWSVPERLAGGGLILADLAGLGTAARGAGAISRGAKVMGTAQGGLEGLNALLDSQPQGQFLRDRTLGVGDDAAQRYLDPFLNSAWTPVRSAWNTVKGVPGLVGDTWRYLKSNYKVPDRMTPEELSRVAQRQQYYQGRGR